MPSPEISRQVGARLEELYRRHLSVTDQAVENYYAPGQGYYPPDRRGSRRDEFGICLTLVDGETHYAGDSDVPFALQSISKVFAYGLALADHGREQVLQRVGVNPAVTHSTRWCSTNTITVRSTRW